MAKGQRTANTPSPYEPCIWAKQEHPPLTPALRPLSSLPPGLIDLSAQAYAAVCQTPAFACIEQHDYDGDDPDSGRAYSLTMALCLNGGISEAPQDSSSSEDNGPTAQLWSNWLRNPNSPIYRALLLRDQHLLAGLLPSFQTTGDMDWSDSDKLYAALNKLLTSEESHYLTRPYLQEAMAQLLGALNAASARLQPKLGSGIERAVSRLNAASQLMHNGIHLTELKVTMKLSEYYALQCEHLRNLQRQAAEAVDRSAAHFKDNLSALDSQARQARRKVRPLIQGGLLSMAVLDPKLAALSVTISVWVEVKASDIAELQQSLLHTATQGVDQLGRSAHAALLDVAVGVGTLDPAARKVLHGLKVTSQQAASWVRTGFSGLRGAVGSGELLLALGGLYLISNAMNKNLENVERVIGEKSDEARLALYGSSLGVLGGGVEVVGLVLKHGATQVQKARLSARGAEAGRATVRIGTLMARSGATISAVAGLYDATQAGMAANRSWKAGDTPAAVAYVFSTMFAGGSAVVGTAASIAGASSLGGPLGIAILLGLVAYGLFKWAEGEESTPLERWARRSYFGFGDEKPPIQWKRPEQAHIALSELNAATLGVEVGIHFRMRIAGAGSHGLGGPLGSVPTSLILSITYVCHTSTRTVQPIAGI